MFDQRPIIACITGLNDNSAVKIIRLSGFNELHELQPFFESSILELQARFVSLNVVNVHNNHRDSVLLTYFKAPKSYTGENILEIACHGNKLSVSIIIEAFLAAGVVRLAGPGEFTYRALLNGKTSLSQVEGLDLFLNATNGIGLSHGFSLLQGELHEKYILLRENFLKLKCSLELLIDFSDDVGEEQAWLELVNSFDTFYLHLTSLYNRSLTDNSSLLNPKIVLYGKTNAGKSSLYNFLLKNDRAIVSSEHGTTRDYLLDFVNFDGINFCLIDTAGLRSSTSDCIEKAGIEKAETLLSSAFYKVLVINPFDTRALHDEDVPDFIVFTHLDLSGSTKRVKKIVPLFPPEISWVHCNVGPIGPDKLRSGPIEPLRKLVLNKYRRQQSNEAICVARHKNILTILYNSSDQFYDLLQKQDDIGILDHELSIIGNYIEELMGIISPEEVLTSIFGNFCIGK